jgi:hypothetical protein
LGQTQGELKTIDGVHAVLVDNPKLALVQKCLLGRRISDQKAIICQDRLWTHIQKS